MEAISITITEPSRLPTVIGQKQDYPMKKFWRKVLFKPDPELESKEEFENRLTNDKRRRMELEVRLRALQINNDILARRINGYKHG